MKNRLIKFRIWDKQLNHFACEGEYLGSSFGLIEKGFPFHRQAINRDFDSQEEYEKFCEQNFIVQQFTGLFDRNEKEIYEGDILAYKEGDFPRGKDGFDDRLEVFWDNQNSKFGINFFSKYGGEGYTGKSEHLASYAKETQIIGNIFETPDLL